LKHKVNLFEILQGSSVLKAEGSSFYFKHPTIVENLEAAFLEEEFESRGRNLSLESESEIIDNLVKSGRYEQELVDEEKDLEWVIEKKKKLTSTFSDVNLLKSNEESIKKDEDRLNQIKLIKSSFLTNSLERYVASRTFRASLRKHCFIDSCFKENIPEDDLNKYIEAYAEKYNTFINLDNILRACYLSEFFDLLYLSEDPSFLFGETVKQMTIFQKDLLTCGKFLHSKVRNLENIPATVRKDPIKLYSWTPNKRQEGEEMNIRKHVQSKGGVKNMKPQDKIT